MGTRTKKEVEKFAKISKFNTAPRLEGTERFWLSTGERIKCDVNVNESQAGNLWLETIETGDYISPGRRFSLIQDYEVGETATIIANVMEPNDNITDEQLQAVEDKFGADSVRGYKEALKNNYVQFHYAKDFEE